MINKTTTQNRIPIQMGERTQNQDQSIVLVSFNTMNTIRRTPPNPIPPDDELLSDIVLSFKFDIKISIIFESTKFI